mgnify:FL=1
MKFLKYVFFDTEDDQQGHASIYEKSNGNTYVIFFIEERYNAFREFDKNRKLIDGSLRLGYKMFNREFYDKDFNRI